MMSSSFGKKEARSKIRKHPQKVVVFLTTLSLRYDSHGKVKTPLDKLLHPDKIQVDLPALKDLKMDPKRKKTPGKRLKGAIAAPMRTME
jgi:hypothetical protein